MHLDISRIGPIVVHKAKLWLIRRGFTVAGICPGGLNMRLRRTLVGSFDLFNVGHLAQITALSDPNTELSVVVVTDQGLLRVTGKTPYLPDVERIEIVSGMSDVHRAALIGPHNNWQLPTYDELHVDEQTLHNLTSAGINFVDAQPLAAARKPANAALSFAMSAA